MTNSTSEPNKNKPLRAVILTALPDEFKAVSAHLDNLRPDILRHGTRYEVGDFICVDSQWQVAYAELGPGSEGAGIETALALLKFDPHVAIFLGVAGGIKDVRIGDVVAADKVYSYESVSPDPVIRLRPDLYHPGHRMIQCAMDVKRKGKWVNHIIKGSASKSKPNAKIGAIATGHQVIKSTDAAVFEFLRHNYNDAIAVEMEGMGFLKATSRFGLNEALVVRGVSDLIDDKAESDAKGSQAMASRHAAAFAFEILAELTSDQSFIESLPPEKAPFIAPPKYNRPKSYSPKKSSFPVLQSFIDDRQKDFMGREFVFDKIKAFLNEKDCGYFVIEGEPGIGKTSLICFLADKHKYLHYFNDTSYGRVSAEQFLEYICDQLIERYQLDQHYTDKDFEDGVFFQQLLSDISHNLTDEDPLIILVDALDEAEKTQGGKNRLLLPTYLPKKIYFIVTTRPLGDEMQLHIDCLQRFHLKSDSQENINDIRNYIEFEVDRRQLITKIQNSHISQILLEKSEGNFMYLHHVLPELEKGDMTVEEIPQGLENYYDWHWKKMKFGDLNHWRELKRPVICVLAAAAEPLTIERIAKFTSRSLDPAEVAHVIGEWKQFLRESCIDDKRLYRLYHSSFKDFVRKKDDVYWKQINLHMAKTMRDDLDGIL